jgi:hypothetical protein
MESTGEVSPSWEATKRPVGSDRQPTIPVLTRPNLNVLAVYANLKAEPLARHSMGVVYVA